jgi:seryl-tRNA synthetase
MLNIKLFRENPEIIKNDLKKRKYKDREKVVDEIIKLDLKFRELKNKTDEIKHSRNLISKEISKAKKEGKNPKDLFVKAKEIPKLLEKNDEKVKELQIKIKKHLLKIPNILHDKVPIGDSDEDNKVIRKFGKPIVPKFELIPHGEFAEKLCGADFDNSRKIAGAGFYFLTGDLALLNQAIIRFAVDLLVKKGYTYVEPPLMMRREPYSGCVDLTDFENVMYKIEGEDLYMIATSEHPLISRFMNEVILEKTLPMKFVGYSMCFRKEIGSAGVDTKGFFRTHQFNKVEQIIFCKPEESWKLFEETQKNSEELFAALELPFRVVDVCSGDIGMIAARKHDIEVWLPRQKKYREVTSCSNCLDYQTRRLNIRYFDKAGNKVIPHTLNNTGVATSRALVAILENYQNEDGTLTIPKVLQKYMGKKIIKCKK